MTSCEWAAAVTAIALAIAKDKTPGEIEFLSLLLSQLASTLATLAAAPPYLLQQQKEGGSGASGQPASGARR